MTATTYYAAIGRRKGATATIKLFPQGTWAFSLVTATGKAASLKEYFGGNDYLYEAAVSPLVTLGGEYIKTFDAQIKVAGGGISGQADAIKLAFARAVTEYNPDLRLTLKPYGHLKRDPRIKERKKPGLKKARKSPTWSKR